MKRLFLSEGSNDTTFLSLFIKEHYPMLDTDRLDISNGDSGSMMYKESKKIREFKDPRDDHEVLIKSENGDENLVRFLGSKIPDLLRMDLDFYVLIDLDGKDIASRLTQFENKLQPHSPGKSFDISCGREIVKTHYMESYVVNVQIDRRDIGNFNLLAFCEDLEDAADIGEDESDQDIIEDKISDILERNQITAPVKRAFSD